MPTICFSRPGCTWSAGLAGTTRCSFDTWLFAIAHNAAMDFLRRRGGESLDDLERPPRSVEPDGLARAISAERAAILAERVSALPALYREALTLRFEEGLKLEERPKSRARRWPP